MSIAESLAKRALLYGRFIAATSHLSFEDRLVIAFAWLDTETVVAMVETNEKSNG